MDNHLTYYITIAAILLILELAYIPIAKKIRIGAKITSRSSHKKYTITSGGFIFYVAALLCYAFFSNNLPSSTPQILICGGVLFLISFIDDIHEVSPTIRLICHTIVAAVMFFSFFGADHPEYYLMLLIFSVGFINGYNFMDGINGMMALYTILTLGTLLFMYHTCIYRYIIVGYEPIILCLGIAVIVFSIFNVRKNAVCFSGDVGSIVLGFFIAFFVAKYIIVTAEASVVVILIVYAVDTSLTIIQRLFMGANIFTPHRLHLYQILVNKVNIPHLKVSAGYALVQLAINCGYFLTEREFRWTYTIIVTIIVATAYFILKRSYLKKV